jgi:hypothetical protein
MITIIEVDDNGDGTYNVTFSENVTVTNPGENEASLQCCQSYSGQKGGATNATQVNATTVQYAGPNPITGYDIWGLNAQPVNLTPATGYQIATGIIGW